jgi:hypothetical protein
MSAAMSMSMSAGVSAGAGAQPLSLSSPLSLSLPPSLPPVLADPNILGELLHSLSQPLTGLQCALALSLLEGAEQQHESDAIALQEMDKIIGMFRLIREYVYSGEPAPAASSTALMPALGNVIEELSSIAVIRDVRICLAGSCTASLSLPEPRLRLALQYLITAVIEEQGASGRVMVTLTEGPGETSLRVEGDSQRRELKNPASCRYEAAATSTVRRAKVAIAGRILQTSGASLVLGEPDHTPEGGDLTGFVLRIPLRAMANQIAQKVESGCLAPNGVSFRETYGIAKAV